MYTQTLILHVEGKQEANPGTLSIHVTFSLLQKHVYLLKYKIVFHFLFVFVCPLNWLLRTGDKPQLLLMVSKIDKHLYRQGTDWHLLRSSVTQNAIKVTDTTGFSQACGV